MRRTIFFDIGGVLIDIHPDRTFQYLSDCIDVEKNIIKKRFPWKVHNRYEKGLLSDKDWFLCVKESLPQPCCLKESDFWKGWKLLLGNQKQTIGMIEKLREKHNIWLLSNTNTRHIKIDIKQNYDFLKLTHGAVYSFDVGFRKPDENIYRAAMKEAKVKEPFQSIFIDDLIINVKAARKIGMNAIHYKSIEQLKHDLLISGINL
tara:strand:- start:2329 stop:2940 length:612 start_codon:yes stop_codon:yes gene_type:complete